MCRLLGLLLFVLTTPVSISAATPVPNITDKAALEAFVDGVVESGLSDHNVAGSVVAIVKDDRLLLAKGYGHADVADKLPVSPETTMFRIGSVTKLFTWTAIMQLEEAGRLDLNKDVNDYLTSIQIPPAFGKPITVANLMTHSGGLEDRIIGLFSLDSGSMKPYGELFTYDLPERVRPPGWVSSYSNHGVGVAGLVLENVSGMSWAEYVESNILEPLGMMNSTAHQPLPDSLQAQMSNGYSYEAGRFVEKPFEFVPLGAAGGISASAVDMTKFAMAHLNLGAYPEGQILSEQTAKRMRSPLFQPHPELRGWLHGFADYTSNDVFMYGHNGGTFWFFTEFVLVPEQNLGIFMSTNTAGGGQVNGALFKALLDRYFPGEPQVLEVMASPSDPASFAGSYATFRHPVTTIGKILRLMSAVTVTPAQNDQLQVLGLGAHPTYWEEVAEGLFQNVDTSRKMKFVDDAAGMQMFIGSAGGSFYKLTGVHTPLFQYAVLGVSLMLLGWALIAWPIQKVRRKVNLATSEHRGRMVAWFMSLSIFVALLGIATNFSQENVYGLSTVLTVMLWIPLGTIALLLVYVFLWVGLVRDSAVAASVRVFHTGVGLSAVAACWLLSYWNLVGS